MVFPSATRRPDARQGGWRFMREEIEQRRLFAVSPMSRRHGVPDDSINEGV